MHAHNYALASPCRLLFAEFCMSLVCFDKLTFSNTTVHRSACSSHRTICCLHMHRCRSEFRARSFDLSFRLNAYLHISHSTLQLKARMATFPAADHEARKGTLLTSMASSLLLLSFRAVLCSCYVVFVLFAEYGRRRVFACV